VRDGRVQPDPLFHEFPYPQAGISAGMETMLAKQEVTSGSSVNEQNLRFSWDAGMVYVALQNICCLHWVFVRLSQWDLLLRKS
jgi:hypothetical protein